MTLPIPTATAQRPPTRATPRRSTARPTTATSTSPGPTPAGPAVHLQHRRGGAVLALGGLTLVVGSVIVPGPFVADVHDPGWVPGHALNTVAFLLLVVGLPALAGSLGDRLRWPGAVGYAAMMIRFALSSGSHLYSLWLLPRLAAYPELHAALTQPQPLASIYGGHNDLINLVLAVGTLGMAWTLWRSPQKLRVPAVMVLLAAACQAISNPGALLLYAAVASWLGLRLVVRGQVGVPLRRRTGAVLPG